MTRVNKPDMSGCRPQADKVLQAYERLAGLRAAICTAALFQKKTYKERENRVSVFFRLNLRKINAAFAASAGATFLRFYTSVNLPANVKQSAKEQKDNNKKLDIHDPTKLRV